MAGTVMHLVIADRLLSVLAIQNPAYFYCGNLAPDAVMARKNYERSMKRHTHFKDDIHLHELHLPDKMAQYRKRLDAFAADYALRASKHREIYLGYLVHMLVDELYILHFRDDFVRQRVLLGHEPTDAAYFKRFAYEVDLVDWELVRTYDFHYPMPEILRLDEPYEIPGLVTHEELLDSKEFIIDKNFVRHHAPEPYRVMTVEQNLAFIELCVEEIPRMLESRYGYRAG